MEANLFASKIDWSRKSFRNILDKGLKEVNFNDNGEIVKIDFKEWILKECFGDCCSEFEEQVMMENLREEFQDYLISLQNKESEA